MYKPNKCFWQNPKLLPTKIKSLEQKIITREKQKNQLSAQFLHMIFTNIIRNFPYIKLKNLEEGFIHQI